MKFPRLSIAAIGFLTLVLAIDFALLRGALMSAGRYYNDWAQFALCFTPILDTLLVVLFRLRKPERRTPGSLGFLLAGTAAIVVAYSCCVCFTETALSVVTPMINPVFPVIASVSRFIAPQAGALLGDIAAILVAMAVCSTPPLLVALLGRSLARRLWPAPQSQDLPAM